MSRPLLPAVRERGLHYYSLIYDYLARHSHLIMEEYCHYDEVVINIGDTIETYSLTSDKKLHVTITDSYTGLVRASKVISPDLF